MRSPFLRRHKEGVSYLVSVILALAFHAGVVGVLMLNWDDAEVIKTVPNQPYYIEATVVRENPFTDKKNREQAKKQNELIKQADLREAAKNKAKLKQWAIDKARQEDIEKQLAEDKHKEELRQEQVIEATRREIEVAEADRLRMEQSLTLSILEEQEYRRAITDDEKAAAYVLQI